jgi:hypothetical protein
LFDGLLRGCEHGDLTKERKASGIYSPLPPVHRAGLSRNSGHLGFEKPRFLAAVFAGLGCSSKTVWPVVAVYAVDDEPDARRWRPRWVMANTSEMGEK